MKLTTKSKFAVTALVDIAVHGNNNPITLQIISERQGISLSYLEQLFAKLRKYGMVKSYKGPGGGYSLNFKANEISLTDIMKAVNEEIDARTCKGRENCLNNGKCLTHHLWDDITNHMYDYLSTIKLSDIIQTNKQNSVQFVVNKNFKEQNIL